MLRFIKCFYFTLSRIIKALEDFLIICGDKKIKTMERGGLVIYQTEDELT